MNTHRKWNMSSRLMLLVLLVLFTLACSLAQAIPGFNVLFDSPTETPITELQPPTTTELAGATVQISAMSMRGDDWDVEWTGSGVFISPDGLILTNAHVVEDPDLDYEALGVSMTLRTDEPPELRFLAEIAAIDYSLDLAVVRVVSDMEGEEVREHLPYVLIGDSDALELGDHLRILGYPGIGGETISFTEGAVSGFTLERGIDGRAWIKTDATIAGGSSGSMGVNQNGELVGIATIVTSGSLGGDSVDCRPIADTNQDGRIDQRDTCIPVGGFINALRPVNLALPLLQAVEAGETYMDSAPPSTTRSGRYDTDQIRIGEFQFSTGVTAEDGPAGVVDAVPDTIKDLYVFWDYEGMSDGMVWGLYWYRDLDFLEDASLVNRAWSGGSSGNWWAVISAEDGLAPGLYEVVLEIEGEIWATDSLYVGEERTRIEYEIFNQSDRSICYVMLSPTLALNWGPDDLGDTEVIAPGESRIFNVPAGDYDLRLLDCDFNTLTEQYDLVLDGDGGFTFDE